MGPRSAGRAAALAVAAAVLGGCTSSGPPKEPEPVRPVRFAVLAAPEVGADDSDLALAVTKLSREKDLAFVLVPGPLLAKDADRTSLELLKNDLGQLAPPVYVAFAEAAPIATGASPAAPPAAPSADEVLTALEAMGPGAGHAVAHHHSPGRAPGLVVEVLGPDGKSSLVSVPAGTRRIVRLGAARSTPHEGERASPPDVTVLVADGPELTLSETGVLRAPRFPVSRCVVIVTLYPIRVEAETVPLEGRAPDRSPSAPLRPLSTE